jgi:hypothetical protein
MRAHPNIDVNQQEIVKKLRSAGVSVEPKLARLGEGIPDLLCGFRGTNVLLEVKRADLGPAAQKLSKDEQNWHQSWGGQVAVVASFEAAMDVILRAAGMLPKEAPMGRSG